MVLRSFGDRVEDFAVSVPLSPSLGCIQPLSGVKLATRCSHQVILFLLIYCREDRATLAPIHIGTLSDRMSTSGTCQLLGRSQVSWSSKKQNSIALSIAEAKYISAGSCCAQLLWMKATLNDFGIKFKNVPLLCDTESAIKMTQNPVQHSRTKHIDIRHHFIRDRQQKGDISIESIGTKDQLADIFTKPLDEKRFCKLRNELNILDFSNLR